jgi:hypothetical protein
VVRDEFGIGREEGAYAFCAVGTSRVLQWGAVLGAEFVGHFGLESGVTWNAVWRLEVAGLRRAFLRAAAGGFGAGAVSRDLHGRRLG